MKYKLTTTAQFNKDYKLIKKRGYDLSRLEKVLLKLVSGEELDSKYKDHSLKGDYIGFRECHIQPDWLLIYAINDDKLILTASRTGSHSDLF
jgi:mRNA interferase YafQ